LSLELLERALVLDHQVALRPLALGGHLRRDHPICLVVREPAHGAQPGAPQRHGRIHQDHGIELSRVERLEEQRDVVHDEQVAALPGLAQELFTATPHGRVDDLIERVERRLVAHHFAPQRRPVEGPVGSQDVCAEAAGDRGQDFAAGRLGLAHEHVRVDDRRPPAAEQIDDGGLAGGDVAGQGDV